MTLGARPFGRAPLGGSGFVPNTSNLLTLRIGPLEVTSMIRWGSLTVRKELSARDELECALLSSSGYIPALGDEVLLTVGGGLQFAGSVHERDVEFLSEAGDILVSQVRCVDLNEIADRRRVVEIFENLSAGAIVRFIVQKYLSAELIQLGDVQDGPMIIRMVVPYLTVADCLDELSEKSGFFWNIGVQREMNFFARATSPAPFTIDSSNAVFRRLRSSRTRNQYRNVQYLDGGKGITDARMESFRGDGTVRTFNVEYALFSAPDITLNFQPQTVGIRGVDSGKQWYWNAGETAIGQDAGGTALSAADRLRVTYQGQFDVMEIVESTAAIMERQSVEGGTGRYEQIDRDDTLAGQDVVVEKARALLRRYATLDDRVEFETDIPGLAPGQLLSVIVPEHGLNSTFIVTQQEVSWLTNVKRRFTMTATTGELKDRAVDFFTQFLSARQPISIREGEILQEVLAMHERVLVTDSVVATLDDVVVSGFGTSDAGTSEFGA